jgi:hypothetical protein
MMTQRQYDYFKALYEEENARFKDLVERGKTYLAVVAAYSGVFAFTADKLPGAATGVVPKVVFCLVAGCFVSALISIVRSLGIAAPPEVQVAEFETDGFAPVAMMWRLDAAWWAEADSVPASARQALDELLWLVTLDRGFMHEPGAREFWDNAALSAPGRWAEVRERARELLVQA